jgi:hypothetical protein
MIQDKILDITGVYLKNWGRDEEGEGRGQIKEPEQIESHKMFSHLRLQGVNLGMERL